MNYTDLLNGSIPAGGYLFYGDEDYLKAHAAARIREILFPDESLADFNRRTFTGETYTPGDLAEAILSPAVMVEKKLVEVTLPDGDKIKDKDRAALLEALGYLARTDDTVLLLTFPADSFDPGTAKKPSAFFKNLTKILTPVEFPLQTDARLLRWMQRHLADYGVNLSPAVGQQILNTCGRSMLRLSGELAKAGAYAAAHEMPELTMEAAMQVITPTDEDDAFRLANCLLEGNKTEAYRCLSVKIRRKEDPILLLAQVTRVYMDLAAAAVFREEGRDKREFAQVMKMHEYKAGLYYKAASGAGAEYFENALERCLDADMAMKSSAVNGYQLLERLVGTL
ncbi:MAG: DNA polymerase III subunit delta [Clostridia bacterium]|nr:DNA polymerase III subunit delta [Clostridia bacterium]